jgi:hypothetical protein
LLLAGGGGVCTDLEVQALPSHNLILLSMYEQIFFRRIRKIAISDYQLRHVCLSVRMEQVGSHWTYFHEI